MKIVVEKHLSFEGEIISLAIFAEYMHLRKKAILGEWKTHSIDT